MGINFQKNKFLKILGIIILIYVAPLFISMLSSYYTEGRVSFCSGEECMGLIFFFPLFPLPFIHLGISTIRFKNLDKLDIFLCFVSLIALFIVLLLLY
jgi:hypothetical protein